MTEDRQLEETKRLIERSSLGTEGARQLRGRTPVEDLAAIRRRRPRETDDPSGLPWDPTDLRTTVTQGSGSADPASNRDPDEPKTIDNDELLTPAEVATVLRVDPKTIARWVKQGRLSPIRTIGGHRRYRTSEVEKLLDQMRRARSDQE